MDRKAARTDYKKKLLLSEIYSIALIRTWQHGAFRARCPIADAYLCTNKRMGNVKGGVTPRAPWIETKIKLFQFSFVVSAKSTLIYSSCQHDQDLKVILFRCESSSYVRPTAPSTTVNNLRRPSFSSTLTEKPYSYNYNIRRAGYKFYVQRRWEGLGLKSVSEWWT